MYALPWLCQVYVYVSHCGTVTYVLNVAAIFLLSYLHKLHWFVSNQHRFYGPIFKEVWFCDETLV